MTKKREYMIELQQALIKSGQFPTCTNCEYWGDKTVIGEEGLIDIPICTKYNAEPPPDVIVTGCIEHKPGIPF